MQTDLITSFIEGIVEFTPTDKDNIALEKLKKFLQEHDDLMEDAFEIVIMCLTGRYKSPEFFTTISELFFGIIQTVPNKK